MRRETPKLDISALLRVLQRREEIVAAYLYSSYASGQPNRQSDADVAAVLRERRGRLAFKPGATTRSIWPTNWGAIGHERVEVVNCNQAPPLVAWEAVRHGHRIFARDLRTGRRLELRTRQRYLDTAHLRAIQDHHLQAIVAKGFSKAVSQ